jgi:hypothetical protein
LDFVRSCLASKTKALEKQLLTVNTAELDIVQKLSTQIQNVFRLVLRSQSPPRWLCAAQQFRQPRDVQRDPSRLVLCQHLCLPCFGFVLAAVEVRERLPVGVADDIAAGQLVGRANGSGSGGVGWASSR